MGEISLYFFSVALHLVHIKDPSASVLVPSLSGEMPVAVEDRGGGAVALMLASLFLLGTWPVLLTLLERRGRLPQHTYLDYSITNLLAAVLMAVAFGQARDSRPDFFTQLTQWRALRKGVPHLVVYTAFFYFSVSCFVLGACLNVWLLYHPMAGVPASTAGAYARDWNGRHWALLAGLLCGFGNGFQFMGGQAAGYAAADAVQALPLVSTFWGVILFGEYRRSSRKTFLLLFSMLSMFIIAVAVLMASAGHRKGFDTNAKFNVTRLHRSSVYQDSTHN
ncbi:unnamed protein product [Miscanthus lutarioriparius]|uniref:Ureide permease 2 n=1 Tax=Miscanthus lutarioriparius TaxID=422564 RepID=A0A811RC13_9POAL|nr:unnamed protein product [Miscanthus lutarioriparius]